eukprot:g1503.t1
MPIPADVPAPQPLRPFKLERYFALHEFSAPHLLCCSDVQSLTMAEVLASADDEARALWDGLALGYTESQGHPVLRAEIAALYESEAVGPESTIVLAPEEGIYLCMRALLQPGDHVIVTAPCYQSLSEIAVSIGCDVSCWEPEWVRPGGGGLGGAAAEGTGMRFDVARLRGLARQDTKLIVINFPHNPTGCLLSRDELDQVVALAARCNAPGGGAHLFSDEMYRLLEYDEAARLPAACDVYARAVSLAGMSKVFAMPGLRIGWLATQDAALLARVQELRDFTTICPSAPAELLALMALRGRDAILRRTRGIVARNLALVRAFMARHADYFAWTEPRAGPIALPMLRASVGVRGAAVAAGQAGEATTPLQGEAAAGSADPPPPSSRAYCDLLVQAHGIMLLPSNVFGFGDRHFRLGLGRENMGEVLGLWEATLVGVGRAGAVGGQ